MTPRDISSTPAVETTQRNIAGPVQGPSSDITAAPAPAAAQLQTDSERFMRIVQATGSVISHYDLFIFLQSKVQHFIPHQIIIAAWGDFRGDSPKFDVVSALPGVRTDVLADCGIEHMLKNCFHRYIAGGRKPVRLDSALPGMENHVSCNCALHAAMKNMRSITVYGVRNERDNQDTLYIAMHPKCSKRAKHDEYFSFLVTAVVSQIDVAFRKVAALKKPCVDAPVDTPVSLDQFSERELEVLHWLVLGRCNSEIAEKLNISAFTVKNHVQRIYKKLAAGNRTEAAEKYRLLSA